MVTQYWEMGFGKIKADRILLRSALLLFPAVILLSGHICNTYAVCRKQVVEP